MSSRMPVTERNREDVNTPRQSPLIPEDIRIYGGIYDVRTGKVEVVVESPDRLP